MLLARARWVKTWVQAALGDVLSLQVITLSRPIFEPKPASAQACAKQSDCCTNGQCLSACYNRDGLCDEGSGAANCTCAPPRIRGVIAADLTYAVFDQCVAIQRYFFSSFRLRYFCRQIKTSLAAANCGSTYTCAPGQSCQTLCYVIDENSNLVSRICMLSFFLF
jgi:hypothetical protein